MAARPGCLVSGRSAGFGSGAPGPPVCRRHVRMAFCRHFEKPQSTLVLDGGLRQPGKSETILPTQEEDESMSGKKNRHLSGREKSSDRPAQHQTDLSVYPLTPDHWDDFEVLFGPRGACAGCWCMWWRLEVRWLSVGALSLRARSIDGSPPRVPCSRSMILPSGLLLVYTWPKAIVGRDSRGS